jgi:hypothetical protein
VIVAACSMAAPDEGLPAPREPVRAGSPPEVELLMNDAAANAVIAMSLILAGWCAIAVFRDRVVGAGHLIGAAVLEAAVLVHAVIVIVNLTGGARPAGGLGTFVGYLAGTVLAPPIGVGLGLAERTRWGSAVLCTVCLVLPVLVVRLGQIWDGTVV